MKRFTAVLFFLCSLNVACAQVTNDPTIDTVPIYKQFPDVPAFSLNRFPDSSQFVKADLKKKTATIIMLFSPDCDHCKSATENLIANMDGLKQAEIVMVSSLDFSWIKKFNDQFHLDKYKNISLSTQQSYFLFEFYGLTSFPSVFVYNKKGKLIGDYKSHVDFKEIVSLLK